MLSTAKEKERVAWRTVGPTKFYKKFKNKILTFFHFCTSLASFDLQPYSQSFLSAETDNLFKRPEHQPSWMPEVVMTKVSKKCSCTHFQIHNLIFFSFLTNIIE